MEKDIFELLLLEKEKEEIAQILSFNDQTETYGLSLTKDDAKELMIYRNESLKKYQRVEFSTSILDRLIYVFCDSQYLNQDNYLDSLKMLEDVFYEFKNESEDKLSDDELLNFMKEQFETVCAGDIGYLETTCLENFCEAIRAGYDGYIENQGQGAYSEFDEVPRWDKDLFYDVLKELFW